MTNDTLDDAREKQDHDHAMRTLQKRIAEADLREAEGRARESEARARKAEAIADDIANSLRAGKRPTTWGNDR